MDTCSVQIKVDSGRDCTDFPENEKRGITNATSGLELRFVAFAFLILISVISLSILSIVNFNRLASFAINCVVIVVSSASIGCILFPYVYIHYFPKGVIITDANGYIKEILPWTQFIWGIEKQMFSKALSLEIVNYGAKHVYSLDENIGYNDLYFYLTGNQCQ